MAERNMPDYDTIQAAVAGKACAVEKKQPDGSMKKEIDADMRQTLVLKLIEAIPQFLSVWRNGKRSV